MLKSIIAAGSALALTATPALAAANPAASLSVAKSARASAVGKGKSELAAPGAIVGLVLAAAVVVAGVIIAVDDGDDSDSN
ncbi:hypothetical protein ACYZX9_04435 [Sphingomonas citri]|jgi:uncharacterized transporter YbjL|uniref:Uncharacterized protein n=1 Tax=Sphingomonas citri TaxID=2862499 RepID=A0ABS7BR12_9SPHN|nr:hypothetical protein [Sphingomonas citri]MBW6532026.1 hypothetical protein [Sphingomonas citri]